ncbi:O-antigen translocase [Vibrio splendidus]|uniref:O-antigen translocase n=1 Tax=Vibrio splendidus TaxID=29497 RepID=UPI001FB33D26|nr:O-antigen translocase [Vibrio splendidus]UOE85840.1 O-antigen translocase [Vibrio splendidus]
MNLFKTSFLSAIASMVRICTGFIVTKIIAVYAGPSGVALIGQLQSFINIVLLGTGNFLKTAVTKYTAEYSDDEKKRNEIWSASIILIMFLNVVAGIIIYSFSGNISLFLLQDEKYDYVLKTLALSLPFFVLNTFLLSILNGLKEIKKYVLINIGLSLISFSIVCILTYIYGLEGALIGYATNQSVVLLFTYLYLRNETWLKASNFFQSVKYEHFHAISKFAVITFTAILVSNLTIMFIRSFLIEHLSLNEAGHWQAIWTLSQVALSLITISLSTYLLPTLSALKEKSDISLELTKSAGLIIPFVIFISITMYFLRDFIIHTLYTKDFLPVRDLFLWQMLGNVFKVCGWLYGYVLVSKGLVKYTVLTEIIFGTLMVLLTTLFVSSFGLVGATYAYFFNSLLHFLAMVYLFNYKVFKC